MNCPYYEEKNFRYCKAMKKRIMIPSRSEKEEFCCEHYRECPYYKEGCGKEDKFDAGARKESEVTGE
jgi:hypothetical protein